MNTQQILHLKIKLKNGYSQFLSLFRSGGWISNPVIAWGGIAVSLLPFFIVLIFGSWLSGRLDMNERQLTKLEVKARFLVKQKKDRHRFFQEFGASDDDFLVNYIESETLLKNDVQLLTVIQKTSDYAEYEPINERIRFLKEGANKMKFEQVSLQKGDFFIEKLQKLKHPVEMNCDDIKTILALVEGVKIDKYLPNPLRPQLTITNFDLSLKPQDNNNKVFSVDMEIMQRGCHEQNHL